MKRSKEFDKFTDLVDRVITVPHSVIQERVEKHRKEADKNPRKRGPKPNGKSPKRAAKRKRHAG